jgi:hypothetical protein
VPRIGCEQLAVSRHCRSTEQHVIHGALLTGGRKEVA